MTKIYRTVVGAAISLLVTHFAVGCTSRSLHTFPNVSTKSDMAMQQLESSTARILKSDAPLETKQDALDRLDEVQSLLVRVDLAAARLAGVPMTQAEAVETTELLRVAYRHLALHASLESAQSMQPLSDESASLQAVEDILRLLSVLTGSAA